MEHEFNLYTVHEEFGEKWDTALEGIKKKSEMLHTEEIRRQEEHLRLRRQQRNLQAKLPLLW